MSDPVKDEEQLRSEIAAVLARAGSAEQIAASNGLLMLAGQIAAMRWGLDLLATERWPAPEPKPEAPPAEAPQPEAK